MPKSTHIKYGKVRLKQKIEKVFFSSMINVTTWKRNIVEITLNGIAKNNKIY